MKISPSSLAVALSIAAVATPLHAQSLTDATVLASAGRWEVLRLTNGSCVGVTKGADDVRATPEGLRVPVRGLMQEVTLSFGSKPLRPTRQASAAEQREFAVILTGAELAEALQNSRMRVQVKVFGRDPVDQSLDISGAAAAIEAVKATCPAVAAAPPVPGAAAVAPAAAAAPAPAAPAAAATVVPATAAGATAAVAAPGAAAMPATPATPAATGDHALCPPLVVQRMRAEGIRETQILKICR